MRAESMQRRPPCSLEAFIAPRTIAGVSKKFRRLALLKRYRKFSSGLRLPSDATINLLRVVSEILCNGYEMTIKGDDMSSKTTRTTRNGLLALASLTLAALTATGIGAQSA